jgi:hypothetical protein
MMHVTSDPPVAVAARRFARYRGRGWWTTLILGLSLFLIYSANDRDLGTDDTLATTLLPLSLARGDGFTLDRFSKLLRVGDEVPPFVVLSHGRIRSRYPVAPALLVLPLFVPQISRLDSREPRWERNVIRAMKECKRMARWSSTVLMVLAAVVLHRFLLGLGLSRGALPAVVAAFLGSDLWPLASQALWQHGPAALALIAAVALLYPVPVSRCRLVMAGIATTVLVSVRLMDSLFAAVIVAWLARSQPRGLLWFLPAPVVGATLLVLYNFRYFGAIVGGQAQLEALHPQTHGVTGTWSGSLANGAAGTLFSPNRGLFVFSPWIALALVVAVAPVVTRRLASQRLMTWLLAALVPYFFILSKYSVWWGGHCFGARYWTDVIPLFAIVLAFGLEWLWAHSRVLLALSFLTIVFAIGVHAIGAFCYPSTWNRLPLNVDLHHERLWDWRDTELSRCLIERVRGMQ